MRLKGNSINISLLLDIIDLAIKDLLSKKLNISNVKHSLEFAILNKLCIEYFVYGNGYYAKALYNLLNKKIKAKLGNNSLKKYYSILYRLKAKNLIILEKKDGMLFIEPSKSLKQLILYLISKMQNSNSKAFKRFSKFLDELSPKPSFLRKLALLNLKDVKLFSNENLEKKFFLEYSFQHYLATIKEYTILLKKINEDKFLKIPYKIRFDEIYKYKNTVEDIIELAITKLNYKRAILLTLTTDPKQFNNLYDATKSFSHNLNRFFSYLKKRFGKRLHYLVVYEFTKSGLLHSHIIIFGVPYLLKVNHISKLWAKYGQGKIVDIKSLVAYYNQKKGRWTYRAKKQNIGDLSGYLSKYLNKAKNDLFQLALFWVTNKRFITFSRIFNKLLNEDNEDNKKFKIKLYVFIGCFKKEVVEDIILYESNKIDYGVIIDYGGDGYG